MLQGMEACSTVSVSDTEIFKSLCFSRKSISMPISSLNCNWSSAVMKCVILICGNFVMQLTNHLYLIVAREGCILLRCHQRGTLPEWTAPNLHQSGCDFQSSGFRANEQDFLLLPSTQLNSTQRCLFPEIYSIDQLQHGTETHTGLFATLLLISRSSILPLC